MKSEMLLIPRYKCIAPVLFNRDDLYNVGDIFTDDGKSPILNQNGDPVYPIEWAKYPHLFEPLPWWKDRKVEDMPEYVKCTATPDQRILPGTVLKITEWFASGCGRSGDHVAFPYTNCFQPATKEEYDAYLQTTNQLKDGQ